MNFHHLVSVAMVLFTCATVGAGNRWSAKARCSASVMSCAVSSRVPSKSNSKARTGCALAPAGATCCEFKFSPSPA